MSTSDSARCEATQSLHMACPAVDDLCTTRALRLRDGLDEPEWLRMCVS